jgi:hypothetical protein
MNVESHSDIQRDFTDRQIQKLYLIHHMHHFQNNVEIYHELHHCFLFEGKDMKGDKHIVSHSTSDGRLQHVVEGDYTGTLFDHDNNVFDVSHGIIAI